MLDFTPVRAKQRTMNEFAATLTRSHLQLYTQASIEAFLNILAFCGDGDIPYVPHDRPGDTPAAHIAGDHPATWSLGQLIAHVAGVAEEYARAASALARGMPYHGGASCASAPEALTTVRECYHRLRESRRTRSASLALWPSNPLLDTQTIPWPGAEPVNANGMFVWSLAHDDDHRRQLVRILFPYRGVQMAR